MLRNLFSLRQIQLTKWSFFVHSSTPNALYVHPRLDSILELCWAFPIATKYVSLVIIKDDKAFLYMTGQIRLPLCTI